MVAPPRLEHFFSTIAERETGSLPDGVSVLFQILGDGGGTWIVTHEEGHCEVHSGPRDGVRPDCRLSCSTEDFQAILCGDLDPREGFLDGRLDLEGDVGLILKLHRLAG